MPLVMVDDTPANNKANANTTAALSPNNGRNNDWACCNSSTGVPLAKKVVAANKIIALLMAHPMTIDNIVSNNSYFNLLRIDFSSRLLYS